MSDVAKRVHYLKSKMPEASPPRTYTADLDGLIDWLRTQPGRKRYDDLSVEGCVFGQFYSAMGLTPPHMPSCLPQYREGAGHIAYGSPHTFGGALKRALAVRDGVWP